MKFLLDVCCSSRSLRRFLVELGHDVREVLNHYRSELESGAVMVVTRGRIRVRPKG